MLLMAEKGIRGEIYHATQRYLKANNNMKNYDKDIERSSPERNSIGYNSVERSSAESSYLMYLDANNLYGWAMSQKFSVDGFKQVKKTLNI